jgi:excisionase family DNA binding protein
MLSPAEVARELGIQERTVRRWAADDVIPAEHTPTGHHRLPASLVPELQQLIKDRVPLNSRNLRARFSQLSPVEEVRPQPKAS